MKHGYKSFALPRTGLTIERAVLITFPLGASYLGFGRPRAGFAAVAVIIVSVLAAHFPSLFFLDFDPQEVRLQMSLVWLC
jgi:hypothetical protein